MIKADDAMAGRLCPAMAVTTAADDKHQVAGGVPSGGSGNEILLCGE